MFYSEMVVRMLMAANVENLFSGGGGQQDETVYMEKEFPWMPNDTVYTAWA